MSAADILFTRAVAFTPGPWFLSGVRRKIDGMDNHSICAPVDGKEIVFGSVWYDPKTHEGFHDAGLIAEAPELLGALSELYFKTVAGTDAERHAALERAWSAIAKATGQ